MEKPTAEEAVKYVSNFINNMSLDTDGFVKGMANEHRTLQQTFTGMCLNWLQHLASLPEGHYDLRNEASVKIAKEIMAKVESANWKRLPFI